jgi:hypothetical protein
MVFAIHIKGDKKYEDRNSWFAKRLKTVIFLFFSPPMAGEET